MGAPLDGEREGVIVERLQGPGLGAAHHPDEARRLLDPRKGRQRHQGAGALARVELGRDVLMRQLVVKNPRQRPLREPLEPRRDASRVAKPRALAVRRHDELGFEPLSGDDAPGVIGIEKGLGGEAVDQVDGRNRFRDAPQRRVEGAGRDVPAEGIEPDLTRLEGQGPPAKEVVGIIDDAQRPQGSGLLREPLPDAELGEEANGVIEERDRPARAVLARSSHERHRDGFPGERKRRHEPDRAGSGHDGVAADLDAHVNVRRRDPVRSTAGRFRVGEGLRLSRDLRAITRKCADRSRTLSRRPPA